MITGSNEDISDTENSFSFFISFLKSTLYLMHFERRISLIAEVLRKLVTAKQVATQISKRPSFMQRFARQYVHESQTLLR